MFNREKQETDYTQFRQEMPDAPEPERKERSRFLAGVITGIVCAVVVIGGIFVIPDAIRYAGGDTGAGISLSMLSPQVRGKVRQLVNIIDRSYYQDVDRKAFSEGIYEGLFSGLDRYSEYYSLNDYQNEQKNITGIFAGIGVGLVEDRDGRVYVTQVYENTPAEKAGLQRGDEITKADTYDAKDMDLDEFVSHIQGEEGTEVAITIRRVLDDESGADASTDGADALAEKETAAGKTVSENDGSDQEKNGEDSVSEAEEGNVETFTKKITRAQIEVPTVLHEMLSDDIGYLAIESFTSQTDEQFGAGVEALQKEGMKKLVIDLRDNGGGDFDAACKTLDEVLPEGLMIYTEDRYGTREDINGTDEDVLDVPIVILVNGNSASSSEVFAGGLRDRGYATLVGTRTYGKGILQSVYQMPDGTGFQLTTQRYFTSKGYSVQDEGGLEPDVEVEYEYSGDSSAEYDYLKDNQVTKAMELLEKE